MKMINMEGKLRRWGHSLGLVIPKKDARNSNLRVGDKVDVLVRRSENGLQKTFGTARFKRSTDKMMREADRVLYNE